MATREKEKAVLGNGITVSFSHSGATHRCSYGVHKGESSTQQQHPGLTGGMFASMAGGVPQSSEVI